MTTRKSEYGRNITRCTNIIGLMDDLQNKDPNLKSGGGGQPPRLPIVDELIRKARIKISEEIPPSIDKYGRDKGYLPEAQLFADILNQYFQEKTGTPLGVTPEHIISGPSSTYNSKEVINIYTGRDGNRILKALTFGPEYIGWEGVPAVGSDKAFVTIYQRIRENDDGTCSFEFDLEVLKKALKNLDINLLIFSRPRNPDGEIFEQEVVEKMVKLAEKRGILVNYDNAYGPPIPNYKFADVECIPVFGKYTIVQFSDSKWGFPGQRKGRMVCMNEGIVEELRKGTVNSIFSTPSFMQAVVANLLENKDHETITNAYREFFRERMETFLRRFREECKSIGHVKSFKSKGGMYISMFDEGLPKNVTGRSIKDYLMNLPEPTTVVPLEGFFYGQPFNPYPEELGYDIGKLQRNGIRVSMTEGDPKKFDQLVVDIAGAFDHYHGVHK